MHIEPGVVTGAKLALGYATGAASLGLTARMTVQTIRESSLAAFLARSVITSGLVFSFFQVLPHFSAGVSEVHLILGSTLFLLFGAGPAAVGMLLGLLVSGLMFTPADLPQFGMNATTLVGALVALQLAARRIILRELAYVDLSYGQVLRLSLTFQAATVAWVAFWVLWGEGFSAATLADIAAFGASYAVVIAIEPLVDLAVLAIAKAARAKEKFAFLDARMFQARNAV